MFGGGGGAGGTAFLGLVESGKPEVKPKLCWEVPYVHTPVSESSNGLEGRVADEWRHNSKVRFLRGRVFGRYRPRLFDKVSCGKQATAE